jgi:tetratricopeptide (TPR) repeat protein
LLEQKWVPLAVILGADRQSPYYNEKDKAGNLYNEGWGLTHMLYFRAEYRPKFGDLLRKISGGKDSAQALSEVYGRTVAQIEKDLQAYLHGSTFQGVLVPAKLDKVSSDIAVEALSDFDTALMLSDLMYRPGKEAAQQVELQRLVQLDPKRPEPYHGLGYLAWRAGRKAEALEQFRKAFDRGDRDPKLLWDYGRLLEWNHDEDAIRILSELLARDEGRTEVRLELAEAQLRANYPVRALATLAPIDTVTPSDSARFFRIAVYSHLRSGDQKSAETTAKHFRDVAKTDEDRYAAQLLMSHVAIGKVEPQVHPVELTDTGRPTLRRAQAPAELGRAEAQKPPERPSITGQFVHLDCQGSQAQMIIETAGGRKVFLIEDPEKVVMTAGSGGPVNMECGPQKTPARIEIGYDPPSANLAGVDGIVKTLVF